MGDGPQAHLPPWFDRPPDAETAWTDRHPAQTAWTPCSPDERRRRWRHQRPADRHAGPSRRGRHPACLSRARDRRDPFRRAVIIPHPRPRAAPSCRTTMLPTRWGRGVVTGGPHDTRRPISPTHDSYPSGVRTTCSARAGVKRACVKRHKRHDERVGKARNSGPPASGVIPTRHRVERTLLRADAIPLLHAELRASLGGRRSHVLAHPVCWSQVTATA